MKFRLQTEVNSSGNLVFSKERYGKGFMYLAFDKNGNSQPVTKDWIIQNKEEIENVRVSGDTIAAVQTKKKIEDFGEKIGGAKKDFFTNRKISISALNQLSLTEREKFLTKSKLWPSIDVEEMLNNGFDKTMIYYIRLIRKYMPTKPTYTSKDFDNVKKTQEIFIEFYEAIQSATYKYKSRKDLADLKEKVFEVLLQNRYIKPNCYGGYNIAYEAQYLISKKFLETLRMDYPKLYEILILEKDYLTPKEKAKAGLQLFKLDDYRVYSIHSDGTIQFRLELKRGNVTHYDYKYCNINSIKILLNSDKYTVTLDNAKEVLNDLLIKGKLYGILYLRNSHDTFVIVTDFINDDTYDSILEQMEDMEEKIDSEIKRLDEENKDKNEEQEDNRKKRIQSNVMSEIKRVGPAVIDKDVVGDDFIKAFGIRGGEFGNWVNDKERQLNMNYCFEAFSDIADVLGIPCSAVAIGHRLGIAFGARGSGNALAHYEPNREVINLTRLKGAGNLAHEYFHFIDDMIAKTLGIRGLASDSEYDCPEYMKNLVNCVKYKDITVSPEMHHQESVENYERHLEEFWTALNLFAPDNILTEEQIAEKKEIGNKLISMALKNIPFLTFDMSKNKTKTIINPVLDGLFDFMTKYSKSYKMVLQNRKYLAFKIQSVADTYRNTLQAYESSNRKVYTNFHDNACELNKSAVRAGHGYWNSNSEMLARAFACYVKDKLAENGRSNGYLCGQAEQGGEKGSLTYPVGLERKEINKAFDVLFESLRNEKFFKS